MGFASPLVMTNEDKSRGNVSMAEDCATPRRVSLLQSFVLNLTVGVKVEFRVVGVRA